MPTTLSKKVSIPYGYGPESFVHVGDRDVEDDGVKEQVTSALQAFKMFVSVALALGVPVQVNDGSVPGGRAVRYDDWIDAGERAILRQNSAAR